MVSQSFLDNLEAKVECFQLLYRQFLAVYTYSLGHLMGKKCVRWLLLVLFYITLANCIHFSFAMQAEGRNRLCQLLTNAFTSAWLIYCVAKGGFVANHISINKTVLNLWINRVLHPSCVPLFYSNSIPVTKTKNMRVIGKEKKLAYI